MHSLVEIKDYSFAYENSNEIVLKNINLEVYKGEFLAIVGSTGAGKTTLCRAITGIVPQIHPGRSKGGLLVHNKSVEEYTVAELAQHIGYVHQDAESQILMTNVEKEIVFPLENLRLPREEMKTRLEHVLDLVYLTPYRHRHPYYLSGGQRQRVVLATALAMNPEILILDEATSEIDPLGAEEIMLVAKDLNEKGKTIIMIEHNMTEMARHADRVAVMNEGRIEACGPTRDVLCNQELLKGLNIHPPEVTQLFVKMMELGADIDRLPVDIEEAITALRALISCDGGVL